MLYMEKWAPLAWLGLAAVLAGVELATPQLISIWFALGAAVTALVSLTGIPLTGQLAVFVLVSCLALLASRPLARRAMVKHHVATNADAVLGMEGVVTEAIDNRKESGRVLVNGMNWSARSEDGGGIAVESSVKVLRIDGAKIIVRPAQL